MTGAVHGSLFASPAPNTILAALRALGKNHPGQQLIIRIILIVRGGGI